MHDQWSRVAGVYTQCLNAIHPAEDYLPITIPGFLAELTARISAGYHAREAQFIEDITNVYQCAHKNAGLGHPTLEQLYANDPITRHSLYQTREGHRRQPGPFESSVETMRRLRDVRIFEETLQSTSVGALLGGSASYGRFFNVKGGADPSDLDILLIVTDESQAKSALQAISKIEFVSTEAAAYALERLGQIAADWARDPAIVFSAKIPLWHETLDPALGVDSMPLTYLASFHMVTLAGLRVLTVSEADSLSGIEIPTSTQIRDYRESPPIRQDTQRSFSGRSQAVSIQAREISGSFVRSSHNFLLDSEGHYYPGMFQNLILPAFDVRWGNGKVRRLVDAFRWKMIDRLRMEQREHPEKYLRLSLAHTRSEVFAPHTVRSVDASTYLA